MINRVILVVLDSVGAGALPDAEKYGDTGADTLGHIFSNMGKDYSLPNMANLGLYNIISSSLTKPEVLSGSYGKMACLSPGKDTTVGHWEIAGIILDKPFPTYPNGFPKELIKTFEKKIGTKTLGNFAASGTEIIKQLGEKHIKSGYPIIYTSADSVFQIAAHEKYFGLEKLYSICKIARKMLTGDHNVSRVIARPFIGEPGSFVRTENRKDFSLPPVKKTILDKVKENGGSVVAIGKIKDIFNGQGITQSMLARNNSEGMAMTMDAVSQNIRPLPDSKSLVFTNLLDFDMLWGHRRDVKSYARGLEEFDKFLPSLIEKMKQEDLLIITADHGCDPTYTVHTDHTREYVPLMIYGKKIKSGINLGARASMSDIAQTIADIFSFNQMENGKSFKNLLLS
ncbi:MAG: phosphopentomutase [Elusimicrobia bacterium]|nr:phosphopentomutase [Elusimicrobiota bacterium]